MNVVKYIFFLLLIISKPSFAYVGPGLGLGPIIIALTTVGAILIAIVAIIYYPIKKIILKLKKKDKIKSTQDKL